jgi:hypothetical protein
VSVEVYAAQVEWERLVAAYRQGHLVDVLDDAEALSWFHSHSDDDWEESFKAAVAAGDRYEELRGYLAPEVRELCDQVFNVFFWNLDGYGRDDLGLSPTEREELSERLSVVLSPETVHRLAGCVAAIPTRDLGVAFREHAKPDSEWYCGTDEQFVAYVQQWFRLLSDAESTSRAIILSIA